MTLTGRVPLLLLVGLVPVVLRPTMGTVWTWLLLVGLVTTADWLLAPRPTALEVDRRPPGTVRMGAPATSRLTVTAPATGRGLRALVRDAAAKYVSGEDRRIAPSVAKLYCTEMVGKVADLAVQVHGGAGYMREVPVERIYREVRLLRLYEGTSEIQRLIIGGGLVRQEKARLQ